MPGTRRRATGDTATDSDADRRSLLEQLRDRLTKAMKSPSTPTYALPQLSRELRAVVKDIAELPAPKKGTAIDEIAARRKARLAKADAPAPPRRGQRRRTGGSGSSA